LALSNERYLAAEGQAYEKWGVPPTVSMTFDVQACLEGKDAILVKAQELARH